MLDRFAVYGVPILAGLVTALVLLGPGRERPVMGARAYGTPCEGASSWALRVEILGYLAGRYYPLPAEVDVELRSGAVRLGAWTGRTADEGIADALGPLTHSSRDPIDLAVRSRGRLLASGRLALGPRLAALPPASPLDGEAHGPLDVRAVLARGVTVPAIPEPLGIQIAVPRSSVPPEGAAGPAPTLSLSATGASVDSPGEPTHVGCDETSCRFVWTTAIEVQAPAAELTVGATLADGRTGSWRGSVPVLLGGMSIDPASVARGALLVRSSVPRRRAYVSLLAPTGRIWGAALALADAGDGRAQGQIPLPALPDGPVLAVVSSDPFEPALAAVGWPLRPALGSLPQLQPAMLVDGLPAAVQQETSRRAAARRQACAFILAAGVLDLAYLWRRYRASRKRLAELEAASAEPNAAIGTPLGLWWVVMLGAGLALAFLALAALALWA
jgi:hypothetical protein